MTINPMNLEGRVVMVTGAGQGIGQGVAELAAELGAKIVAVDVKPDGVEALAGKLGKERALSFVGSDRSHLCGIARHARLPTAAQ